VFRIPELLLLGPCNRTEEIMSFWKKALGALRALLNTLHEGGVIPSQKNSPEDVLGGKKDPSRKTL